MLARNNGRDQLGGDSILSAVVLNPHFAIADVYMQNATVNAVNAVPAVVDQFVMIVRFVKNDFCFDAASRRLELGLMQDQFTNDAAILVQCFHPTITCRSTP
jgi:hypothetical protein